MWIAESETKREKPWKREFATYLEMKGIAAGEDRYDWSPPRVSTPSPLDWKRQGFVLGLFSVGTGVLGIT